MSSPSIFRRLKESIKAKWPSSKADPDDPRAEKQHRLEAEWEKALTKYAAQRASSAWTPTSRK